VIKLISVKLAGNIILTILSLMVILHLLIILKILPSDFIWGGQIDNTQSNLFILEILAIGVTLVFIFFTAVKTGYIKNIKLKIFINIGIWFMFIYFLLNIFGNLASTVLLEKMIFTPVTVVLALLTFRLAIEK
jgi:hypothetical protein